MPWYTKLKYTNLITVEHMCFIDHKIKLDTVGPNFVRNCFFPKIKR